MQYRSKLTRSLLDTQIYSREDGHDIANSIHGFLLAKSGKAKLRHLCFETCSNRIALLPAAKRVHIASGYGGDLHIYAQVRRIRLSFGRGGNAATQPRPAHGDKGAVVSTA